VDETAIVQTARAKIESLKLGGEQNIAEELKDFIA
jgi:hypothetical protein